MKWTNALIVIWIIINGYIAYRLYTIDKPVAAYVPVNNDSLNTIIAQRDSFIASQQLEIEQLHKRNAILQNQKAILYNRINSFTKNELRSFADSTANAEF